MKENEKRIAHLYVCTVVIPELGSDRIYEGIYSTWLLKFLGKSSVKHSQIHQVSYSISALRN